MKYHIKTIKNVPNLLYISTLKKQYVIKHFHYKSKSISYYMLEYIMFTGRGSFPLRCDQSATS